MHRPLARKATEIVDALALERAMNKDEILTTYLNVAPFGRNNKGQNIAGAQQAAEGIFGVDASQLTVPQAAFFSRTSTESPSPILLMKILES